MKKPEESVDNSDKSARSNSTDQDELLKGFDKKRRDFLKKLLISTAYVTPAILTLSMRDLEAKKKKPTGKKKKNNRGKSKSKSKYRSG